jgi:2,4-dienoyl-CoA reductase (NADPH2)
LKNIAGIESNVPLKLLAPGKHVAATIFEEIRRGDYGTIVMGKRGLSGVKRLLVGSVSGAVLGSLENQSLFLVD